MASALAALVLLLMSCFARADRVQAIHETVNPHTVYSMQFRPGVVYNSVQDACVAAAAAYSELNPNYTAVLVDSTVTGCRARRVADGYDGGAVTITVIGIRCPDGTPKSSLTESCGESVRCPTATPPYTLLADQMWCERSDPCTKDKVSSSGVYDYGTNANAVLSFGGIACSSSGCKTVFVGNQNDISASLVSGVTHYFVSGKWVELGTEEGGGSCTPSAGGLQSVPTSFPSTPASTCGANQDGGTINGKWVCLDKTTGLPAQTSAPSTSTTTTNKSTDATTGNVTTTTTTTNSDGSKSETVAVTNSSGVPISSVTTTTPPPTGTTPTPKLAEDPCVTHPNRIGCLDAGDGSPIADPGQILPVTEQTISFNPTMTSAGTCPPDVHLPRGIVFSYKSACESVSALRPLVLAVTYLLAGFFVFGAMKIA